MCGKRLRKEGTTITSVSDIPLQKLLVDEKRCYLFGRDKDSCDFPLQHQSCSRQHAALVYHKHLNRPFLIDLGSSKLSLVCSLHGYPSSQSYPSLAAHGTFVGTLRLEPFKPTQIPVDTTLSFGASTRTYTLRYMWFDAHTRPHFPHTHTLPSSHLYLTIFVNKSKFVCALCAIKISDSENDPKLSLWWEVEKVERGREELYLGFPNWILMWM